jgi:hypothetical protein
MICSSVWRFRFIRFFRVVARQPEKVSLNPTQFFGDTSASPSGVIFFEATYCQHLSSQTRAGGIYFEAIRPGSEGVLKIDTNA